VNDILTILSFKKDNLITSMFYPVFIVGYRKSGRRIRGMFDKKN
jgi:hypothetical protein